MNAWATTASTRETAYKAYLKRMEYEYKQQKEAILEVRKKYVEQRIDYLEAREAYRADKERKRLAIVFLREKAGEGMGETVRLQEEAMSEGAASGSSRKSMAKKKK